MVQTGSGADQLCCLECGDTMTGQSGPIDITAQVSPLGMAETSTWFLQTPCPTLTLWSRSMQRKRMAASLFFAICLATSLVAQTKTASIIAASTCSSTYTTGAGLTFLSFCITSTGNVMQLQNPAGIYYISSEGYALCSSYDPSNLAPLPVAYDAAYFESNWGAPTITQPHGPNTFPLTIVRLSTGGFKLKQTFSRDTSEDDITITMTLTNQSGSVMYNVQLDRYLDADADNTTSNIYGRSADNIYAYVDLGSGIMMGDITRTVSHTTAVHTYGTWVRNTCNQASTATPTPYQDGVGRISYLFGTMNNGASKTVKVVIRRW
jgi:hypothetical protein